MCEGSCYSESPRLKPRRSTAHLPFLVEDGSGMSGKDRACANSPWRRLIASLAELIRDCLDWRSSLDACHPGAPEVGIPSNCLVPGGEHNSRVLCLFSKFLEGWFDLGFALARRSLYLAESLLCCLFASSADLPMPLPYLTSSALVLAFKICLLA